MTTPNPQTGMAQPASAPPSGTLASLAAGSFLSTLDLFIVNIAFPSIRSDLPGANNQSLGWALTIYAIMFAALLVPAGRLGDRFGRRHMFRGGMAVFALASALCALAPNVPLLVAARGLQGLGAAMMIPSSMGLLLASYPKERHTSMIGIWAACGAIGGALGPVVGGALVQFDWRLIFLINLPVAIAAIIISGRLRETPTSETGIPDLLGSAFLALAAGGIVAAVSYVHEWGIQSPLFIGILAASLICAVIFVYRCLTRENPALNLALFKRPVFSLSTIGLTVFYTGFSLLILGGPLYMIQVWHWTPFDAGLGFALGPVTAGTTSILAGRLGIKPRNLAIIGSISFMCAGLWWLMLLDVEPNYVLAFLPGLILGGISAGASQTGFIALGSSSLPANQYGAGSGTLNTARQIGGAIGIAILLSLTGAGTMVSDYTNAWIVVAICGVVAAISGMLAIEFQILRSRTQS